MFFGGGKLKVLTGGQLRASLLLMIEERLTISGVQATPEASRFTPIWTLIPVQYISKAVVRWLFALCCFLPLLASGQTLNLNNDVQKFATLANTTATLTGKAELHVSNAADPIAGSVIHLNSPDAWLFLTNIAPSRVVSTFLSRVRVNGAAAVLDSNVRVVQYEMGAVVIPHGPDFSPMEVFDGRSFTGPSKQLRLYTYYNDTNLGALKTAISSFKLKRGYMATVAEQANGAGASKVYIAQDGDVEVGALPGTLDNRIRFIRIFPWRWVGKKGWAGGDGGQMRPMWWYDWGSGQNSSLDTEYVPMRHNEWWDAYPNNKTNVTHVLGYNEPERPDQANLSVNTAIARWPELMASGLRLGAPAPSDGGLNWLYEFIDRCDALGYRVDFVPVHYYLGGQTAQQFYDRLLAIYQRVRRPLWVTEFNNGANWTCCEPTPEAQKVIIGQFIEMLDNAPFVERYSIYNWVGDNRRMVWDGGWPTAAGEAYRDNATPLAQVQELPDAGTPPAALYAFDGDARDSLGNGHDGTLVGAPTFVAGKHGQALSLDGDTDYVQLSPRLGDSTDFSFGGWVNWSGGGNWQRIFDFGDGTSRYLCLTAKSDANTLRFIIKNGGTEQQLNAPLLTVGQWTHVAVTISGNTGKLFINGTLVNTNTGMTINPVDIGTKFNFIGKSQWPDPLFKGRLDDLRFFSTALTDAQVAAMAGNAPPRFNANPLIVAPATRLQPYTASLTGTAIGGSGALTYRKVGGPAWLAVAADGNLTGVPTAGDGGLNRFLIGVTDATGALGTTTLNITVAEAVGMTARYSFDSTANAAVGAAHGVTTGSPAYAVGRIGMAIDLDGTDDFVSFPRGMVSHGEITIATWVQWDGGGNWQRIFDFGNGTGEYLYLSPKTGSNTLRFEIKNNGGIQVLETTPLATGQWVHLAVTLGANTGRLYVNGVLADTKTITIKPSDFDPASNFLGKSQFTADPFFNGRIDEFMIFNQALNGAQVAELMTGRAPKFSTNPISKSAAAVDQPYDQTLAGTATDPDAGSTLTFSKVSGPEWLTVSPKGRISGVPAAGDAGVNRFIVRVTDQTLLAEDGILNIVVPGSSGLLAHYQFDGNTIDQAGGGAGVATGAPGYDAGLFDRAIRLDGVDDFVRLPAGLVNGLADITIATRVRWEGGGNWQRLFDFGNDTNQYLFLTPKSGSGTLRFAIKNSGNEQIVETAVLPVGEWTHVAVTLIGNTGTLYVNGAAVDSRPITIDPSAFAPIHNYLGKSQFNSDPLFTGSIDDFRVYNRGLSPSEIAALAVPPAATIVPDPSFEGWAAGFAIPTGQAGPQDDPDRDGVLNLLEYLSGSHPLVASADAMPQIRMMSAAELGLGDSGATYLTLQARVRKQRPGITLVPEAAASVEGLATPEAASHARQALPPLSDGEFEIFTYYYDVALEDSPRGMGVIRLRVILE